MDMYNNTLGSPIDASGVEERADKCTQKAKNAELYWFDPFDRDKYIDPDGSLADLPLPTFAPICTAGGFHWVGLKLSAGPPVLSE